MPELVLIFEDAAQEGLIRPLVERIAAEEGVPLNIRVRSARGGFARVCGELADLAKSCAAGQLPMPDGVLAVVDANCRGHVERRRAVEQAAGSLSDRLVPAIPDPHIERWFLLDSRAFKKVVGRGCRAPDEKCEKDRYKRVLVSAVIDAGVEPLLGGIEYAKDLAAEIDLLKVALADNSFGHFRDALRAWLKSSRR